MAEIVFHKLIRKIAPNKVVESLISTQVRFLPLEQLRQIVNSSIEQQS